MLTWVYLLVSDLILQGDRVITSSLFLKDGIVGDHIESIIERWNSRVEMTESGNWFQLFILLQKNSYELKRVVM